MESIQSGNYGHPPNAWWWLKQSFIYFCGLMGMKICVLILFMLLPWLSKVGDWALGWTEGNEKLQIVFVMMLFPLIMNALQYYIIDSYIKAQDTNDGEDSVDGRDAPGTVVYGELTDSDTEDSEGEDEAGGKAVKGGHLRLSRRDTLSPPPTQQGRENEYDPAVDGDVQTVVGSSASHASHSSNRRGVLQKELIPHE